MVKELIKKWENEKEDIINATLYKSKDFKHFKKHMKILGKT